MPIMFNQVLLGAGLDLKDVRLLRHANSGGRNAYELWRDDRDAFLLYQSVQSIERRPDFGDASRWASFGSTVDGQSLFLVVYDVSFKGIGKKDIAKPHAPGVDKAGKHHRYEVRESEVLQDLAGRLYIEWGRGTRSWVQRPDRQNKVIVELREKVRDPDFPGYARFLEPLSRIEVLPLGWKDALRSSRGIYLLTCPRTREQYVGKADGSDGLLGRWLGYVASGHGGNVELKSREPSDYQVSILETAGSAASGKDILEMEIRWKQKLQSREMGLNRN
jgi:hypothetical protein